MLNCRCIIPVLVFLFSFPCFSQEITSEWISENYTKREVMIPMRDGISLYTAVYEPVHHDVDEATSHLQGSPVIIIRTPYSCSPYGDGYASALHGYLRNFTRNRYIVVFQNVRGKYMSEGVYENVRPFNPRKKGVETDEASDTYDTVEWLVNNTVNNGRVGVTGVSYPGFYATMGALSGHPAVKAVSPQAPVLDWYMGDDAHHNGVRMLLDTYSFGGSFYRKHSNPALKAPGSAARIKGDTYGFFLSCGTMSDITETFSDTLHFWNQMNMHPDYDSFWQDRNPGKYLKDIGPAVLVVGGQFDTDDCYGALNTYRLIREQSPSTPLYFVYGPWYHGGWHDASYSHLGQVWIGEGSAEYFMDNIEYPFFRYYLEGKGLPPAPVSVLPSGSGRWKTSRTWPADNVSYRRLYLRDGGRLMYESPEEKNSFSAYRSDPERPVPYSAVPHKGRYKEYMAEDQRFASTRQDVLTYMSEPLEDTLKLEGPLHVSIAFSTDATDADLVVKLIDVFPLDFTYPKDIRASLPDPGYMMGGYQMLVRGDVFRARYRESFSRPSPVVPGEVMDLEFDMDDISHWFMPGHCLMVQIQSSWFPLADRNPQKYLENVYEADEDDYTAAEITVYHQKGDSSFIVLPVAGE